MDVDVFRLFATLYLFCSRYIYPLDVTASTTRDILRPYYQLDFTPLYMMYTTFRNNNLMKLKGIII